MRVTGLRKIKFFTVLIVRIIKESSNNIFMDFKLLLLAAFLVTLSFSGAAQGTCEVLEAQEADIADKDAVLQRGMTLEPDTVVETGSNGEATFLCADQVVTIGPGSEGEINVVGESESIDTNTSIEPEVELSEALKKTDQMEQNLDAINEQVDRSLPGPLKSLVLGDRVNFRVDNTTLGIKSNDTAITGFEEGGVDDPTLEITMEESTIEEILQSNNTMNAFSDAYDGEGIQVEAHSFGNKVIFGAVSMANKAYGFFSGLM